MKLARTLFIAAAVLLPVSWTVASAADPAPAADSAKKDKKAAKGSETAPTPAPAAGEAKTEKKAEKK